MDLGSVRSDEAIIFCLRAIMPGGGRSIAALHLGTVPGSGEDHEVHIERPMLPIGIETLTIRDLPVAQARIDIEFHRTPSEVVVAPRKHVEADVRVLAHL